MQAAPAAPGQTVSVAISHAAPSGALAPTGVAITPAAGKMTADSYMINITTFVSSLIIGTPGSGTRIIAHASQPQGVAGATRLISVPVSAPSVSIQKTATLQVRTRILLWLEKMNNL